MKIIFNIFPSKAAVEEQKKVAKTEEILET